MRPEPLPPARPFVLRPAVPGDAAGCARVHHTSWIETYSALLPASHWETDTLARREQSWQRWLEGGSAVTVAETVAGTAGEEGGEIIGFALTGAARRVGEHAPVRERELFSIYVLAAHHGGGAGQALLEAALPAGTPAQLWVAEQNPRARRFYARNGFAPDGVQVRDAVLDLEELRLVR